MPGVVESVLWTHAMAERKPKLLEGTDAVVAHPGGCDTFEELLEVITLKRLGLYLNPIVIVNQEGFSEPLVDLFKRSIQERFMDEQHLRAQGRTVSRRRYSCRCIPSRTIPVCHCDHAQEVASPLMILLQFLVVLTCSAQLEQPNLDKPLALFFENRFQQVLPLFEDITNNYPENVEARTWLAETYRRLGRTDDAIRTARTVLDLNR